MAAIPPLRDIDRLCRRLERAGVDCSQPGFYDAPGFKALETSRPEVLQWYFPFVEEAGRTAEYTRRAQPIIEESALFLHSRLIRDGRKGACIDASLTLVRFLENQRIWAVVVVGAARVRFPEKSGVATKYFWEIMPRQNPAKAGHVWVYAPPYVVVDVALDSQPYTENEQTYLEGPILVRDHDSPKFSIEDLAEPEMVTALAVRGVRTVEGLDRVFPNLPQRIRRIGPVEVQHGDVTIAYLPCAISAPDGPFADATNLMLSGKNPIELYEDFVATNEPKRL